MLVGDEPFWRRLVNAIKLSAEEEFYRRLHENRVWPFLDLGGNYYYLVYRSNRFLLGLIVCLGAISLATYFFVVSGLYAFPLCALGLCIIFGILLLLGQISKRELILNKKYGYLLRLPYTRNVLVEGKIYNIYIRLQRKLDSSQQKYFYVIVGGYCLEDIRITRKTANEQVMKVLARYLAHNLGINYFDYHDETVKHEVYHFRESLESLNPDLGDGSQKSRISVENEKNETEQQRKASAKHSSKDERRRSSNQSQRKRKDSSSKGLEEREYKHSLRVSQDDERDKLIEPVKDKRRSLNQEDRDRRRSSNASHSSRSRNPVDRGIGSISYPNGRQRISSNLDQKRGSSRRESDGNRDKVTPDYTKVDDNKQFSKM